MNCSGCGTVIRGRPAGRGLCWACYRKPEVRAATPRFKPGPKNGGERAELDTEPTAAELEATIAEQMASLPAWWADECERERPVYQLVKCT